MPKKSQKAPGSGNKLLLHQGRGKIERVGDQNVLRFRYPRKLQGHNVALDIFTEEDVGTPEGPFRLEYVLFSDFELHRESLVGIDPERGHSDLVVSERLSKLDVIRLTYQRPEPGEFRKEALVRLITEGKVVQRLSIELPETELNVAVRISGQFISSILDAISFRTGVPIQVRHIEVHSTSARKFLRRYLTVPYGQAELTEEDLRLAAEIPKRLAPCLRLFREGVSSSKPHYRLLCLHRAREAMNRVQAENNNRIKGKGGTPGRPRRLIPDDETTREYLPDLIGKQFGALFEVVRRDFRIPIAHAKYDDFERLMLDPADVIVDHRIDAINAVLIPVVRQLIADEWELIRAHELQ